MKPIFIVVTYIVLKLNFGPLLEPYFDILEKSHWNKILFFQGYLQTLLMKFFKIFTFKKFLLHTAEGKFFLGGQGDPPEVWKFNMFLPLGMVQNWHGFQNHIQKSVKFQQA